jgi:hypothetical protein
MLLMFVRSIDGLIAYGLALVLGARASRPLFTAVPFAPMSSMSQQERAGRPRSQG